MLSASRVLGSACSEPSCPYHAVEFLHGPHKPRNTASWEPALTDMQTGTVPAAGRGQGPLPLGPLRTRRPCAPPPLPRSLPEAQAGAENLVNEVKSPRQELAGRAFAGRRAPSRGIVWGGPPSCGGRVQVSPPLGLAVFRARFYSVTDRGPREAEDLPKRRILSCDAGTRGPAADIIALTVTRTCSPTVIASGHRAFAWGKPSATSFPQTLADLRPGTWMSDKF